jgi:hypothetical protein
MDIPSNYFNVDKLKPIVELDPTLSLATFDMRANLFKLTMQSSVLAMMQKPFEINLVTKIFVKSSCT